MKSALPLCRERRTSAPLGFERPMGWMCRRPGRCIGRGGAGLWFRRQTCAVFDICACAMAVVGATGFEPATPWSRTKCATRLRYAPKDQRAEYRRGSRSLSSRIGRGSATRQTGASGARHEALASQTVWRLPPLRPLERTSVSSTSRPARRSRLVNDVSGPADHTARKPRGRRTAAARRIPSGE